MEKYCWLHDNSYSNYCPECQEVENICRRTLAESEREELQPEKPTDNMETFSRILVLFFIAVVIFMFVFILTR